MTPLRKKIAIAATVLVVLLLVAAGVSAYVWNQATALPEWYTAGELQQYTGDPEASDGPIAPSQWIALDEQGNRLPEEQRPPGPGAGPILDFVPSPTSDARREYSYEPEAEATPPRPRPRAPRTGKEPKRHELRGFHHNGKRKPSPAIRASRAVYEDGRLEIGIILDLQRLPRDKLGPRDRARYERAIDRFPGVMERDIWVGVDDEPLSVGGYLALSPEAEVRVGKLRYSLDGAAERLGMTPIELRLEVNRALRQLGFVDPAA